MGPEFLTRAQQAFAKAEQMRSLAARDNNEPARLQLLALAESYEGIYRKLLQRFASEESDEEDISPAAPAPNGPLRGPCEFEASDGPAMEYELRLHASDGRLSIVMIVLAASDREAQTKAGRMLDGVLTAAHIWRDGALVDVILA